MKDVSFVRYSPKTSTAERTAQLIECYRDVFADKPWHEWLLCAECGLYWGVKDKALLAQWEYRHCNVPLVDFWQREKVLADLRHEIAQKDALSTLALDGERVIGFCWGYPISVSELEQKIGIRFNEALTGRFGAQASVGYQDEVGVLPAYRGRKIARELNRERIRAFERGGLCVALSRVRRSPTPSVTFLWYTKRLGYEILAEYPDSDGRVILASSIDNLARLL